MATIEYDVQVRAVRGGVAGAWSPTAIGKPESGLVQNRPPEPVGRLPDRTLQAGGDAVAVDVSTAFRDADDDTLTYRPGSSAPPVAAVSSSGSTVVVTSGAAGAAMVTVAATDVGGSNTPATQTFRVTVTDVPPGLGGGGGGGGGRNSAPEAVGTLPDRRLDVGAAPLEVEVVSAFRDPDGDVVTYAAASSDPGTWRWRRRRPAE